MNQQLGTGKTGLGCAAQPNKEHPATGKKSRRKPHYCKLLQPIPRSGYCLNIISTVRRACEGLDVEQMLKAAWTCRELAREFRRIATCKAADPSFVDSLPDLQ